MMKNILIIMIIMLLPGSAFATAQIPDYIMYKGETYSLFSEPLERYFSDKNPRPKEIAYRCSALWRGYVASWAIKENHLYLTKVVEGTCDSDAKEIALSKIFPGQESPVKAIWFSGVVRIPQGKQLYYEHMGYDSVYERELLLTVKDGKVTGEKLIDTIRFCSVILCRRRPMHHDNRRYWNPNKWPDGMEGRDLRKINKS